MISPLPLSITTTKPPNPNSPHKTPQTSPLSSQTNTLSSHHPPPTASKPLNQHTSTLPTPTAPTTPQEKPAISKAPSKISNPTTNNQQPTTKTNIHNPTPNPTPKPTPKPTPQENTHPPKKRPDIRAPEISTNVNNRPTKSIESGNPTSKDQHHVRTSVMIRGRILHPDRKKMRANPSISQIPNCFLHVSPRAIHPPLSLWLWLLLSPLPNPLSLMGHKWMDGEIDKCPSHLIPVTIKNLMQLWLIVGELSV